MINNTDGEPYWAGPICIDNLSSGASVGDQFAARAFACMNDSMLVKLVSTVRRYIQKHELNQEEIRLDWDAMCKLSEQAPELKQRLIYLSVQFVVVFKHIGYLKYLISLVIKERL